MPIPPVSATRPAPSAPNPAASPARAPVPVSRPGAAASVEASPVAAPAPVLALFVAPLPEALVTPDSALSGAVAPEDPSEAPVPIAACDRPVLGGEPGVDRPCRVCGTEEAHCVAVACAVLPDWVTAWVRAPMWPAAVGLADCGGGDGTGESAE